jgi:hypothetical protein
MTFFKCKWGIRENCELALQEILRINEERNWKYSKNNGDNKVVRHKTGIVELQTKKLDKIVQK